MKNYLKEMPSTYIIMQLQIQTKDQEDTKWFRLAKDAHTLQRRTENKMMQNCSKLL